MGHRGDTAASRFRDRHFDVSDLESAFWSPHQGFTYPTHDVDEVFPNVFIGNAAIAENLPALRRLGINFVVNAGYRTFQTSVDQDTYRKHSITLLGLPIQDMVTAPIHRYFQVAADFIDGALKKHGRVLVHCAVGVSRSAAIVIAFLMIKRNCDVFEAVGIVRARRPVHPNRGFLQRLCELNNCLLSRRSERDRNQNEQDKNSKLGF